jgi:hypothetical protein
MLRKFALIAPLFFAFSVFAQRSLIIAHDDPVQFQVGPHRCRYPTRSQLTPCSRTALCC